MIQIRDGLWTSVRSVVDTPAAGQPHTFIQVPEPGVKGFTMIPENDSHPGIVVAWGLPSETFNQVRQRGQQMEVALTNPIAATTPIERVALIPPGEQLAMVWNIEDGIGWIVPSLVGSGAPPISIVIHWRAANG